MRYTIELPRDTLLMLKEYFDIDPFVMQAAFLLTDVIQKPGYCKLHVHEARTLGSGDYEYRTAGSLCFRASAYVDALKRAGSLGKSIVFMHSRARGEPPCRHTDEKVMFRMAYACIPFGIHASLYYQNDCISGVVWLPGLKSTPLNMLEV